MTFWYSNNGELCAKLCKFKITPTKSWKCSNKTRSVFWSMNSFLYVMMNKCLGSVLWQLLLLDSFIYYYIAQTVLCKLSTWLLFARKHRSCKHDILSAAVVVDADVNASPGLHPPAAHLPHGELHWGARLPGQSSCLLPFCLCSKLDNNEGSD